LIFKLERVGELVLLILLNLLLLLRVVHNFLIFRGFVNIIMSLLRRISIERNYPNLTLLNLILILLWLSRLACKKVIILIILIFCAKWLKLSIQELIRILTFLCYKFKPYLGSRNQHSFSTFEHLTGQLAFSRYFLYSKDLN